MIQVSLNPGNSHRNLIVTLPDGVDHVPDPSVDPVAHQGQEAGLHGHGQLLPVASDAEDQPHQRVHDPGMETCARFFSLSRTRKTHSNKKYLNTVVEEDQVQGYLGQGVVWQGGVGTVSVPAGVVEDGLADAEEEKADAQAAREQHHEPCHLQQKKISSQL